jgi:transposase
MVLMGGAQRLAAFKKLGQTIKIHWDGILALLAYHSHKMTSAPPIESINGIIQTARRRAEASATLKTYWMAGDLHLKIPSNKSITKTRI